jgi:hypothetical protein
MKEWGRLLHCLLGQKERALRYTDRLTDRDFLKKYIKWKNEGEFFIAD